MGKNGIGDQSAAGKLMKDEATPMLGVFDRSAQTTEWKWSKRAMKNEGVRK